MRKQLSSRQEDALSRMREILQNDFLQLRVDGYQLNEDFNAGQSTLLCTVHEMPSDVSFGLEAEGVGLIDAFFNGLVSRYAVTFPSLQTLRFTGFNVKGLMNESDSASGTDAKADATISMTNSYGVTFEFGAISPSVSQSSLESCLAAVEYFVNSEKAYVQMYRALKHYRTEGRMDLVSKYTDLLSDMVQNTSYSSIIEELQNGDKD